MSASSYEHLVLIGDTSDFGLEGLREQLKKVDWGNREVQVLYSEKEIKIVIDSWSFYIGLSSEAHIQEESEELAVEFARENKSFDKIRSCKRRLELDGDPDFDMDYFNDFCFIL